ncbi:type II toxin-antitoxin system ParD family antitoxin [Peteryoungia desertarenae]|uniref:Type II toxin-antitoxin system ParD family antitoxin n=1 Tax=Peteryoungia desertarenae TaxID=1813451 RepID=A0ABX6QM98_9HYPH|nr:type II toxin-antitoxin system ParD family antitoxin [Peteryoungia desertarenae]QLF69665.1 type II toxin-antitoxin system ParD family antitoxin [Peteryoungia desertarenae]
MSNTTSINLGDHFTAFLAKLTASGRYGSASEAVRAGLRLLEEEEARYEALLNALDEGETSGESERTLDDILVEAKARQNGG